MKDTRKEVENMIKFFESECERFERLYMYACEKIHKKVNTVFKDSKTLYDGIVPMADLNDISYEIDYAQTMWHAWHEYDCKARNYKELL